jgi:transposase-like protein
MSLRDPHIPVPTTTPGPAPVQVDGGWAHGVQAWISEAAHSNSLTYAIAGLLALLLALSIRSRRKRAKVEAGGNKAHLTRTDKAITRITGLIATAVLAQGMWVFFGDELHLPPELRVVLFAFVEFQIISAWRRAIRTLHRHGHLGTAVRTIYVLAFGSAFIASWHAGSTQLGGFRWFVAFVAAYMIAEELAEELDIFLTANPEKCPGKRAPRRINWALSPERVFVWLRLAEPKEREIEDVDRRRRIARFARTAYRLDTLKVEKAWKWRISLARRSLRRQSEQANEHLNVATDTLAMFAIRSQLAFLYQVEAGTTRAAVSDLSPFTPAERLAIAAEPFTRQTSAHNEDTVVGQQADRVTGHDDRTAPDTAPDIDGDAAPDSTPDAMPDGLPDNAPPIAGDTVTGQGPDLMSGLYVSTRQDVRPDIKAPARRTSARTNGPTVSGQAWTKEQVKAFAMKDSDPDTTYTEIARKLGVADKTVSRWFKARESADGPAERSSGPDILPTFTLPREPVTTPVNGYHPTPSEEN